MNLTDVEPTAVLADEWQRIELLGHCLAQARQGHKVEPDALERLQILQEKVSAARNGGGAWEQALGKPPLEPLEYDVLACAVAPEARPRLGWLFQSLQPGVPQPYPTPALLQELLLLDTQDVSHLYNLLAENSRLRRDRLIELESDQPYEPIRPGAGLAATLLGRPLEQPMLPGATRVCNTAQWSDLVLPPDRIAMIHEFLYWVQHRSTVVDQWGGMDCGGPVALFSGPSGTGKTYAASVIANELGWPLYRVDLGKLISKYIGETERNLNRLFDAAHGREMVLQFDEADSVFGKRGQIKEARDRYANLEVSHLLTRVETHHGPCILTTNLRGNLDGAFIRRFQVVVEFPRPDAAARAQLWRRLLPPRAPKSQEVEPSFLANAVSLTGGGIRNAALHAAFLAAAQAEPRIGLEQIALAVWRELAKEDRELSPARLGKLAAHLKLQEQSA